MNTQAEPELVDYWAEAYARAAGLRTAAAEAVMRRFAEFAELARHEALALDAWENEGGPGPAEHRFQLVQPVTTVYMTAAPGRTYRVVVNMDESVLLILLAAARGENVTSAAQELLGYLEMA